VASKAKSKTSHSNPSKAKEPSRAGDPQRPETQTMEDLLTQYGASVRRLSLGDKVKGVITAKLPGRVVVDIGGKSEGIIAEKAYKEAESLIKNLKVGDEIQAQVIVSETPDGYTILSLRQATADASWTKLQDSREKGTPISVEGISVTNAGVMVDVSGLTGFIPKSQLGKLAAKNPQALIARRFEAVVIDTDRPSNKVVLSEKEVSEKDELELVREAIKSVKESDTYEGEVTSVYDFGCFVKVNVPLKGEKEEVELEGLVHISELSWDKVGRAEDAFKAGDKVKVKVIGKTNGKLAFSIRQTQEDPWDKIEDKYKKESRVKGKISKLTDFGVFVQLEPGIEGLVHLTKIPPGKSLAKGDSVNVYVEEIDPKEKRISLGLVLTEKPVGYK